MFQNYFNLDILHYAKIIGGKCYDCKARDQKQLYRLNET